MPRSGTKLLRDLLNEHPLIGIPLSETGFLPYMVGRFGNPPPFENPGQFAKFYSLFSQTPFFVNEAKRGRILEKSALENMACVTSWSSIFETILRFYAPPKDHNFIWGDKTPGALAQADFLKQLFPIDPIDNIVQDLFSIQSGQFVFDSDRQIVG